MKIQAVRGMQDLLPRQQAIFSHITATVREVVVGYGYEQIGMPILESTSLFKRAVGEATDIVEKEMYTFDDRNGESLTMRPEGTAGCVRLAQQHGLTYNQIQRFWYSGPMFRHERPQKGRYRQFDQIGAECFGMTGPDIDAELLLMTARIWQALGLQDDIQLQLNSLGSSEARAKFRAALVEYLTAIKTELDEDSQRRLTTNPLRILDSKVDKTQQLLVDGPKFFDYIDAESRLHFDQLCELLDARGVAYVVNPAIVRGLDYYNKTVFEWVTTTLGAQGTVCAGGRYDGLVEQLGGKPTPGIGFAMGLDRLALMLEETLVLPATADIYIASMAGVARTQALLLAESIRDTLAGVRVVSHCAEGKFKAQLKKADASGALVALVIGDDEAAAGEVGIKPLRADGPQVNVKADEIIEQLQKLFPQEMNAGE
ncbi:MAG: histidyl-tRNA synthetase [Candidatus Azotimanducaceae bacterium]